MAIKAVCVHCGATVEADEGSAGKLARCGKCLGVITVPRGDGKFHQPPGLPVQATAKPSVALANPRTLSTTKQAMIALAFLLACLAYSFLPTINLPEISQETKAKYEAMHFVLGRIKTPSTASFPEPISEWVCIKQGDGSYIVSAHVDAQNLFGAMLRNNFKAVVQQEPGSDDWRLKGLEMW